MRRASTLVEVLVMVAIIATLFSLLLPVLQIVREKAARDKSLNNLRQIGLAIHDWHDHHGSRFPLLCDYGTDAPTDAGVRSLFSEILPQLGHADVFALYKQSRPM